MKRLLLVIAVSQSLAYVEDNIGIHSNVTTKGVEFGFDVQSDYKHYLGGFDFKAGEFLSFGMGGDPNNAYGYVVLGERIALFDHHVFTLAHRVEVREGNLHDLATLGYQRQVNPNSDYWVEFTSGIEIFSCGCLGKTNYSLGVKRLCFSYE